MTRYCLGIALWLPIGFFALGVGTAHAYLDPGTGSMILQAIIGAVTGALIVIKLYWYKLKTFFKGGKATDADGPDKDSR